MTAISIIICTRNRAESLRETLTSIGACSVPSDVAAEVLVIDNGSTDHTQEVVAAAKMPRLSLRCLIEPKAGQCQARNRGLRESTGSIILFTDDDVRPPIDWIEGMCRPILIGAADAVAGGVHVPPHYEAILNREPYRSRRGWFACTEYLATEPPTRMVGANMAFSRAVANAVGQFDLALGPGALGFYDETLFCWQMLRAGFRLITRLEVSVEHHFDLSRLDYAGLLRIARSMGRSEAYIAYHWRGDGHPPASLTLWRARIGLASRRLLQPWARLRKAPADWEIHRVQATAYLEELDRLRSLPRKYVNSPEVEPSAV